MTKDSRIDAIVLVKAQFSIPSMSFLAMSMKDLNLSSNRDLIFEPDQLDTLTLSAHVVDHNVTHIVIRNDISQSVTLSRYTRLNKVLKYEAKGYFQIDSKHIFIAERPLKSV